MVWQKCSDIRRSYLFEYALTRIWLISADIKFNNLLPPMFQRLFHSAGSRQRSDTATWRNVINPSETKMIFRQAKKSPMTASSQLAYCVVTRDKRQRRACPTKSQLAGRLTTLTAYLQWIPSATLRQGERMRLAAFAAYTRTAQADAVTLPWRRSANQPRSYPA